MNSKITKMILEFNNQEAASIKSFAIKKKSSCISDKVCYLGKCYVCKISLMSFIYEMLETFCFPDKNVR